MPTFADFDALSFDCYGTLIDWETGIATALAPWAEAHGLAVEPDDLVAAFSANETHVQQEHPTTRYPDILAETMRRVGTALGAPVSDDEAAAFGASVGEWPAFPDSSDALHRLHTRYRLIILSNVDRASFARSAARLGVDFDLVITAEDVGAYKPSPLGFAALLAGVDGLGVPASGSSTWPRACTTTTSRPRPTACARCGSTGGGGTPAPRHPSPTSSCTRTGPSRAWATSPRPRSPATIGASHRGACWQTRGRGGARRRPEAVREGEGDRSGRQGPRPGGGAADQGRGQPAAARASSTSPSAPTSATPRWAVGSSPERWPSGCSSSSSRSSSSSSWPSGWPSTPRAPRSRQRWTRPGSPGCWPRTIKQRR